MKTTEYKVPTYIYFIWASLALAALSSLLSQAWTTLFISVATFCLTAYAVKLCKESDFHIPAFLLNGTVLFIYATLFLGEVANFYERFWWWDIALHAGSAVGFGLIGVVVLVFIFGKRKSRTSPWTIALFAFCFAMAVGAVWEIFEFLVDYFFNTNMQKSGLTDTMGDLMVDACGGLVAAYVGYRYTTSRKDRFFLTDVIDETVEGNNASE